MNCTTCGLEVDPVAAFCQHCGAPLGGGTIVAVAEAEPPIRFTFEASALGLFGRSLLLAFSFPFLFPVPWTISWFWKWLAGEVRAGDAEWFRFLGAAENVWKIVLLYILLIAGSIGLGFFEREDEFQPWLLVANILIQVFSLAPSDGSSSGGSSTTWNCAPDVGGLMVQSGASSAGTCWSAFRS